MFKQINFIVLIKRPKYTMANYFARCLILPEEEFKKVLQEYQMLITLSKYFSSSCKNNK